MRKSQLRGIPFEEQSAEGETLFGYIWPSNTKGLARAVDQLRGEPSSSGNRTEIH